MVWYNSTKGLVTSVNLSKEHAFSKSSCLTINFIAGIGVEGDAHGGRTAKHTYLVGVVFFVYFWNALFW